MPMLQSLAVPGEMCVHIRLILELAHEVYKLQGLCTAVRHSHEAPHVLCLVVFSFQALT